MDTKSLATPIVWLRYELLIFCERGHLFVHVNQSTKIISIHTWKPSSIESWKNRQMEQKNKINTKQGFNSEELTLICTMKLRKYRGIVTRIIQLLKFKSKAKFNIRRKISKNCLICVRCTTITLMNCHAEILEVRAKTQNNNVFL